MYAVQRMKQDIESTTGLQLPERDSGYDEGIIIAVGPGITYPLSGEPGKRVPVKYKVGQRVRVPADGGYRVDIADYPIMNIRENRIMAVLDGGCEQEIPE